MWNADSAYSTAPPKKPNEWFVRYFLKDLAATARRNSRWLSQLMGDAHIAAQPPLVDVLGAHKRGFENIPADPSWQQQRHFL